MIRREFDPTLPLRFLFYGRMSSDRQNPRSPEQQKDNCLGELKRLGYPWVECGSYIDRAISGRLTRKRPEFARMISDIRTGRIQADVIVVDSFERFGRAEELESLRRQLAVRHGVLVVTADSHFSDPSSVAGKVLASYESLRSTEENRLKAHGVLRGKKDAVRQKHWPGGKPPFGYRLESVMVTKDGRTEVDHHILVKDTSTNWIVAKTLQIAAERSWGCSRLTRMLNEDPEIPDAFKPFCEHTIHRWLGETIYYGELVWAETVTDIVDDCRVVEKNDPADVVRVPDFCEPTISKEAFDRNESVRRERRERARTARAAARFQPDKLIRPTAPGLALKFALSGLVKCGHCDRAMTISTSPPYTSKDGTTRTYASYHCAGSHTNACPNRARIPEPWIRKVVIDLMLRRLFASE